MTGSSDNGIAAQVPADMSMAEQYDRHRAYLRRHGVSRRNFLSGSAAAAAVAALGVSPFGVRAYARDSPLAVANRRVGYGDDAASQLRLSAQLSRNPSDVKVFVDYGASADLGATVEAEVRELLTQIPDARDGVLASEQFYAHAAVNGLAGQAPLFYRWRTGDGYTSDVRSTATAMPSVRTALAPFRFTMMGDQGTDDTPLMPAGVQRGVFDDSYYGADNSPSQPHTANVLNQIIACRPQFHLLAGDIAYADTTGRGRAPDYDASTSNSKTPYDRFNPYVWDVYLNSIEASASTTPWMFATGNHDMEFAYPVHGYGGHLARLSFPGTGPAPCPSAYTFVYGNVAVLSLDANDVTYEITPNTGYSGGAQNSWAAKTLAAHRANPNVDFIVAFFHHCAYSTTKDHASDGGVRDAWCGLFDQYRVDLVLQGHNHVFERTDPVRDRRPTRVAEDNAIVYPDTDGTLYYVVGSAGRPRYPFQDGELESYRGHVLADTVVPNSYVWTPQGKKQAEVVTWSRVRYRNYAFLRIDVRPGAFLSEMDVVAVDEYGAEFDKLTLRRPVRT